MTLLVVRLRAARFQDVQDAYTERHGVRTSFGCTSSRLLVNRQDLRSAVVLMEFPSFEAAQDYTASFTGVSDAAMSGLVAEYLEDVASSDHTDGFFTAQPFRGSAVEPIVS